MPMVHTRAVARQDLVSHYFYLAENAGEHVAERFLINAEASFADLSEHPAMDSPLNLRSPELKGMRKWQVRGFDNILIFYLPRDGNGVSVGRVLHVTQDWWKLLSVESSSVRNKSA
ncbi:type II toxin-antitoxin system RelE/ParE family toxin [Glaciimonas sp. GG7]